LERQLLFLVDEDEDDVVELKQIRIEKLLKTQM
jgi:hypothetical protein